MNNFLTVKKEIKKTPIVESFPLKNQGVLVTELYNEKEMVRCREYEYCLQENLKNPYFKEIHILYQTTKNHDLKREHLYNRIYNISQANPKVKIYFIEKRLTFQGIFSHANSRIKNSVIVAAVADTYVENGIEKLNNLNMDNLFITLTLHTAKHHTHNPHLAPNCQGVYIFKTPIQADFFTNFIWSTWGSDNRIVAEIDRSQKYKIFNPALDIIFQEYHSSHIRHHQPRKIVPRPWKAIHPHLSTFEGIPNVFPWR